MKKSLSIFKYEFTNLKRDKIFWIAIILYAFGYQQVFSAFVRNMKLMGGFISLIRLSWLPINLVMIPLLIIASDIGANRDEVFDIMDIRPVEKTTGKALAVMALAGILLFINILITIIIALVSKVSLPYFWYLMKGHISNVVLSLMVLTFVGLLAGELLGHILSGIISFLVIVVFFILTCTFYKTGASILTLYNIPVMGSNFNLFRYDQYFTYHKLLWISVAIAAALGAYMIECRQSYRRTPIVQMSMAIVLVVIAVFSTVNGGKYKPVFYQIVPGFSSIESSPDYSPYYSYIPSQNPGYKVEVYDMNVDLSRNFMKQIKKEMYMLKPATLLNSREQSN